MTSKNDKELEGFSKNLQICMKRRNLNQTALAGKTGISQAAVSRYLKALACPGGRELRAMANALGVSMDYLWCGKGYTKSEIITVPSTQSEKEQLNGRAVVVDETDKLKAALKIIVDAVADLVEERSRKG